MKVSPIDRAPSVRFALAAQLLVDEARAIGIRAPAFRSPPRVAGTYRTITRRQGSVVVAVRIRGRPFEAVLADMVEGIVLANKLGPLDAARCRARLWDSLHVADQLAA